MPKATQQFFAMVLDYYRAPRSHPDSVDAATPVPRGFSSFLDCLARPEERLAPVARSLGCHSSELLAASCFYIRQLLFVGNGDHYRILGLSANADNDAIRRRYRLLISLFHPDRITVREQWEEQFVRRLNHAYSVLKHPQKRHAYDQELKRSSQGGGAAKKRQHGQPVGRKMPPRVVPHSGGSLEFLYRYRLLQRYPKVAIWLAILLLLGTVLLVFLSESRTTALTLAKPEPASANVADRLPADPFSSVDVWTNAASEVGKESLPGSQEYRKSPPGAGAIGRNVSNTPETP
ncbi:J domain-containing protein [Thiolapillus sp.]